MPDWDWVRSSPARAYSVVTVLLVVTFAATTSLARYYHEEEEERSRDHFARGTDLVESGDLDAGIVQLRAALLLDRGNPAYALVLATALLDAERPRQAQTYLEDSITADPTSGPANLVRARIARDLGEEQTAIYYQRAYFGSWPVDARAHRVDVGFELVDYLLALGASGRARAVLTQLAEEAGNDPDLQLRVGRQYLAAGAPDDAARLLGAVTEVRPDEPAAWSALAVAEFALGDDETAARAAARAAALDPEDARAARIAEVAGAAIALDPTRPRLGARERTRRARVLVERARDAYRACVPAPDADAEQPDDPIVAEATRALDRRTRQALDDDALIDLAGRLWDARRNRCPEITADLEALDRLLGQLRGREVVS